MYGWDKILSSDEQYKRLGMIISWASERNVSVKQLQDVKNNLRIYEMSEVQFQKLMIGIVWSFVGANPLFDWNTVKYYQAMPEEDFNTIFGEYSEEFKTAFQAGYDDWYNIRADNKPEDNNVIVDVSEPKGKNYYVSPGAEGLPRVG